MRLFFDTTIKTWREAKENEDKSLTIDNFLIKKLNNIKILQSENWDCVFIICGDEGSGKSTLAFICGQYLSDMGLTLDNIANGSDDALKKLENLPDNSILIVDEAELLFSSRDTMTKEQRQLTKIFMIIRQKRMVLILVTPDFHELNKYIACKRSRFLIRTFANKGKQRGYFAYWGTKKKTKLYYEGKKNFGSYLKPRPEIYGFFVDYKLPFDKEYQRIKLETLMYAFENPEKRRRRKTKEIERELEEEEQEQIPQTSTT